MMFIIKIGLFIASMYFGFSALVFLKDSLNDLISFSGTSENFVTFLVYSGFTVISVFLLILTFGC